MSKKNGQTKSDSDEVDKPLLDKIADTVLAYDPKKKIRRKPSGTVKQKRR